MLAYQCPSNAYPARDFEFEDEQLEAIIAAIVQRYGEEAKRPLVSRWESVMSRDPDPSTWLYSDDLIDTIDAVVSYRVPGLRDDIIDPLERIYEMLVIEDNAPL